MFIKLKNKFIVDGNKFNTGNEIVNYGYNVDGQFKGISYFKVEGNIFQEVLKVVPERYRKNFAISYMKINDLVPAHTDNNILTSINFYIKPGNCLTQFYELKYKNIIKKKHPSTIKNYIAGDGLTFDEKDLNPTKSFIAEENDVWLLDVTKPHAVKPLGENTERIAITVASLIYDYNLVCKMLKETGNL